jgi:hypothetical protein
VLVALDPLLVLVLVLVLVLAPPPPSLPPHTHAPYSPSLPQT